MEPTMKEIAEWLYDAGCLAYDVCSFHERGKINQEIWNTRAAQVEAMGERRCGTCEYTRTEDAFCWNKKCPVYLMDVNRFPDFGCTRWERKEG